MLFASMAAYALPQLRFPSRRLIFGLTIAGIMIPPQVLIPPIFQQLAPLQLSNTYPAVILPAGAVRHRPRRVRALMTIPVGRATLQGSCGQRLSDAQASSILGALPLIILFLIFQRRIVEGVAGNGLNG